MNLGPHAAYIWSAYTIVIAALSGLVAWLVYDGRRYRRLIDEIERRGVRRGASRE